MNEAEPLNCAIAGMLHGIARQEYTDGVRVEGVEVLKEAVDILIESGPDEPCDGQRCPTAGICLRIAEVALELRYPELPISPEGV